MEIYLVRHCQTTFNELSIHQNEHSELSPKGKLQAEVLSGYFAKRNRLPDLIVSSPRKRAYQTATIIGKKNSIPVICSDLVANIKRPSQIIGKRVDDPLVIKIFEYINKGFGKNGWRYSDEESYEELATRMFALKKYLTSLKLKRVLVVSHGSLINALSICLKFDKTLYNPNELIEEFKKCEIKNCSITFFKYDGKAFHCKKYNDLSEMSLFLNNLITTSESRPNEVW